MVPVRHLHFPLQNKQLAEAPANRSFPQYAAYLLEHGLLEIVG
jgi:hypothetical protein